MDAARAAGSRYEPPMSETGFVYLGRWTPPSQSLGHATMPPPIAAYVIQVTANSTSDSEESSAFVVVDAMTGAAIVLFDGCSGGHRTTPDAPSSGA